MIDRVVLVVRCMCDEELSDVHARSGVGSAMLYHCHEPGSQLGSSRVTNGCDSASPDTRRSYDPHILSYRH